MIGKSLFGHIWARAVAGVFAAAGVLEAGLWTPEPVERLQRGLLGRLIAVDENPWQRPRRPSRWFNRSLKRTRKSALRGRRRRRRTRRARK